MREGFLDALYEPGERVLIFTKFKSQGQFIYWVGRGSSGLADRPGEGCCRRSCLRRAPDGVWFLCQPVSGEWKVNPACGGSGDGVPKLSRRSRRA